MKGKNMYDKYVKRILGLSGRYSVWDIWHDFINMFANSIANAFDKERAPGREEEYLQIRKKYSIKEWEAFIDLSCTLIDDLERNPDRDVLGEVYMSLRINCKEKGQYFTPYYLSKAMAKMILQGDKEGPLIINEPACGSGSNLIAAANALKEDGFNYQQDAYFVAQDIDAIVAKMCYIQMSLLRMPGVVIIGNSLLGMTQEMDYWYTPFHYPFGEYTLMRYRKKYREEEQPKEEKVISFKEDWMLKLVGLV